MLTESATKVLKTIIERALILLPYHEIIKDVCKTNLIENAVQPDNAIYLSKHYFNYQEAHIFKGKGTQKFK